MRGIATRRGDSAVASLSNAIPVPANLSGAAGILPCHRPIDVSDSGRMVKSTLSESDIRDLFISPVIRRAGWDPSPIRVSALATTKAQFRDGPFSRNFLEPRSNPRLGRNSRPRACPRRRSTSIRDAERNSVHRDSRRAVRRQMI
jgi:hypothetical protein